MAQAPVSTPALDRFIQDLIAVAKRHNVDTLVIVGVDPQTRQQKLYGSADNIAQLKSLIASKLDLMDRAELEATTEWTA